MNAPMMQINDNYYVSTVSFFFTLPCSNNIPFICCIDKLTLSHKNTDLFTHRGTGRKMFKMLVLIKSTKTGN